MGMNSRYSGNDYNLNWLKTICISCDDVSISTEIPNYFGLILIKVRLVQVC